MASVDEVFESAYAKAKAELMKEYGTVADEFQKTAHAVTGIVPQVKKAVTTDADGVEDSVSFEDLMDVIKNLRSEVSSLKRQAASAGSNLIQNAQIDFAQGGEPVPHNLHLDDGTVIKNFPGVATHYTEETPATATSDATSTVKRVIAAYPVVANQSRV
jgi:hypothetical protein